MYHAKKQLTKRITNQKFLAVGFSTDGKGGFYEVGKIKISDLKKEQINQKIEKIKNTNFGKNKSFAVLVSQFNLSQNNIIFKSEEDKEKSKTKQLFCIEKSTSSISQGNFIFAIVRGNKICTVMFVRSQTANGMEKKLRVDDVVKSVEKFILKK